ncbi:MAG: hypothetical protein RLZZ244_3212 [Verrucomicrobiota bacterium]|jgi:RNA polymerase sigma-70 factor (ECF subfamily)
MTASEIEEHIVRVLQGDGPAFGRLVREFSLPLRGYLHARLHHRDDADDLAQEVFVSAFQSLSRFRIGASFQGWLFGIANHKLLQHYRTLKRRDSAVERFQKTVWEELGQRVSELSEQTGSHQIERLLQCIEALPEKLRGIVRAHLTEEKVEALAERLKTTRGTIYTLNWRAMKLLRSCMLGSVSGSES